MAAKAAPRGNADWWASELAPNYLNSISPVCNDRGNQNTAVSNESAPYFVALVHSSFKPIAAELPLPRKLHLQAINRKLCLVAHTKGITAANRTAYKSACTNFFGARDRAPGLTSEAAANFFFSVFDTAGAHERLGDDNLTGRPRVFNTMVEFFRNQTLELP